MKKVIGAIVITILFHYVGAITVSAEEPIDLDSAIKSESVILIDAKTGYPVYEKESHKKMYPASITKIATAIVALESADPEEIVTVSKNARNVEGTRVYLEEGEQASLNKLLLGMIINSGNDAAVAIAEHIDGTVDQFAFRMNTFVREKLGLTDTTFTNPHGLFDENHYTTAADMAEITRYALKNKKFTEIIGTETLEWDGESWDTTLITHHKLFSVMPYEGMIGGKNGYVQKSGQTLVTVAEREGVKLIAVTLNATGKNQSYKDTVKLLDYGFEHYDPKLIPKDALPKPKVTQEPKVEKKASADETKNVSEESEKSAPLWPIPFIIVLIAGAIFMIRRKKKNSYQRYYN